MEGSQAVVCHRAICRRLRCVLYFLGEILPQTSPEPIYRYERRKPKSVLRQSLFICHDRMELIGGIQLVLNESYRTICPAHGDSSVHFQSYANFDKFAMSSLSHLSKNNNRLLNFTGSRAQLFFVKFSP